MGGAGLYPPVMGLAVVESFRRRDCEDVMKLCMYSRGASGSAFIMGLSNLKVNFFGFHGLQGRSDIHFLV